jgi:hypothetical protein
MARHKEDDVEGMATMHQDMESPKLTFAALDARIEALPVSPSDTAAFPKKAKWGLFAAAAGALFGLLSVKLLPGNAMCTLVLAYTQFKDMHWPPHPSWVEIFLIVVLVLGYWLSVLQISVRLRFQLYETLLSKTLT